ncbi:MAG: VOC family protein [Bacteroidia bacterium]|nr:VOC family protein [Bacteroidia bacterium]
MNPVVHFEIPYTNAERISKFYSNVFGWKLTHLGENSGNYILATTAVADAKPGQPAGAINGGFYPVKPDWPAQFPSIVIGVGDMQAAMNAINSNGGKVLGDPMMIPGFGLYFSFLDTEGNRNSVIQPTGI